VQKEKNTTKGGKLCRVQLKSHQL